jgi:hypothetical protein
MLKTGQLIFLIVAIPVAIWLILTPIYDYLMVQINNDPTMSVVLGLVIICVGYFAFKIKRFW